MLHASNSARPDASSRCPDWQPPLQFPPRCMQDRQSTVVRSQARPGWAQGLSCRHRPGGEGPPCSADGGLAIRRVLSFCGLFGPSSSSSHALSALRDCRSTGTADWQRATRTTQNLSPRARRCPCRRRCQSRRRCRGPLCQMKDIFGAAHRLLVRNGISNGTEEDEKELYDERRHPKASCSLIRATRPDRRHDKERLHSTAHQSSPTRESQIPVTHLFRCFHR